MCHACVLMQYVHIVTGLSKMNCPNESAHYFPCFVKMQCLKMHKVWTFAFATVC